jgi:YHS domain-containing protein
MKMGMLVIASVLAAGMLAGCGGEQQAESTVPAGNTAPTAPAGGTQTVAATGQPLGSVKVGDKAVCAVCSKGGHTSEPEETKAVLDYKGKTYAFCSEGEKAEFISNPTKYADAGQ